MGYTPDMFDDIRPFYDEEIGEAMQRLTAAPELDFVFNHLFPDEDAEAFKKMMLGISSTYEFQYQVMEKVMLKILENSTKGFSYGGFEHLDKDKGYQILSNHRDILLDSALLQFPLHENELGISEISFGSNLMMSPFIIDFGRCNQMYTVHRGGSPREVLKNSMHLSDYVRYSVRDRNKSLWLAQRGGRTKNGIDKTDPAILKMFHISGRNMSIAESLSELNILPVSISYEFEPCDALKTRELFLSLDGAYEKRPGEDLESILTGVLQPKGRIHIQAGTPLNGFLSTMSVKNDSDAFSQIAAAADQQIYTNFKLWPNNYIANDLMNDASDYDTFYSIIEKELFENYMEEKLSELELNQPKQREIFLGIYGNPVNQKRASEKSDL